MSKTYIGIAVTLLVPFLPKLGLQIGTEELTTTITTLVTFAGALYAFYGRWKAGGITILGTRA